jgi:hypothetical protein
LDSNPPQSEIARNPDHIDINKVIDKLTGDVEGEKDDQLSDDNYEEETSDVNADHTEHNYEERETSDVNATEQGRQRQSRQRPRRVITTKRRPQTLMQITLSITTKRERPLTLMPLSPHEAPGAYQYTEPTRGTWSIPVHRAHTRHLEIHQYVAHSIIRSRIHTMMERRRDVRDGPNALTYDTQHPIREKGECFLARPETAPAT